MNTEQEETFRVLNEALGAIHDMENRITALLKTMASETTIRDRRFQRGIQSARVALKVAKYRDKILALHAEGLCNTDIANQIGLHRSTTRLYTRVSWACNQTQGNREKYCHETGPICRLTVSKMKI